MTRQISDDNLTVKMKRTFFFSVLLLIIFSLFSCSGNKILFIHDQYYPYLFKDPGSWQKNIEKAASAYGFSIEFRQIEINGNLPEINAYIEKTNAGFIMTSALFSSRIKNALQNNKYGKIYLDLNTTGNSINPSHIILPSSRDDVYRQAGILSGRKSNELKSDAAGIFLTGSPAAKNEMNSFIDGYNSISQFNLITRETEKPQTSPPDLSDIPGAVLIYFISAGEISAKTAMETVTDKYVAGEYLDSISSSRDNMLFSIEYDPIIHFRRLLELSRKPAGRSRSEIAADYFKIIKY